jgi:hypothetical protein
MTGSSGTAPGGTSRHGVHAFARLLTATSLAAVLVAGLAVVLAAGPPTTAAPADPPAAAPRTPSRTTITFTAAHCRGCQIQILQGLRTDTGTTAWYSRTKTFRDARASFTTRTKHTRGLQAVIHAPWEGHTTYATNVVFRYGHTDPGDRIRFHAARHKHRASPCWAGTHRDTVIVPLVVREVRVQGLHHRVPGSIAFTGHTRRWLAPMIHVRRGVLGSQDAFACHAPPAS